MGNLLIVVLLLVNTAFVLAILFVLFLVLRQGRRVARLAREAQELAQHVQPPNDLQQPPKAQG